MKNKILVIIMFILTLIGYGCNSVENEMYISCDDKVIIEETMELKVFLNNEEIAYDNLKWSLSDYSIANIIDNKLIAKNYGKVVVSVVDITNNKNYCSKSIEVVPPFVTDIIINGKNELYIDKTTVLTATVMPSIIESEVLWSSSNEEIIIVDEGEVYAVGVGTAEVIVTCDNFEKRYEITVLPTPTTIEIIGQNNIKINQISEFTYNIDEEVQLTSSNESVVGVVDNAIIGVSEGRVTITAVKVSDPNVTGTIEVIVKKGNVESIEMTDEERQTIETILNTMTLEQKVGQMFSIGFYVENNRWGEEIMIEASTGLPYAQFGRADTRKSMLEYIQNYRFGNFTIYSEVGKTRNNLKLATNTLKELAKSNTTVNPLITIDTNGGFQMEGLTALPTNQALATANINTISNVNKLYGSELYELGINSILNTYVNNNFKYNSTLSTYGSNITKAMATSVAVSNALASENVIMIPNTSIYGQYSDERTYEELKATDLKLLETAIQNGSPIISLPAAEYKGIKENYYTILNEEFIQKYIREQLNFDGVIYLGDGAINVLYNDDRFYTYIVDAINLGVDMIGFDLMFSNSYWSGWYNEMNVYKMEAYNHIISNVESGVIKQERIDEAVTRILLAKLRNNVLTDKQETNFNFEKVSNEIMANAPKFITVIGNNFSIEKDENILIISEAFEKTGTTNSLGDNFRKYFEDRGYDGITIYHADTLYPDVVLNNAGKYDKVIIAISDIGENSQIGFASSKVNLINFVNQMKAKNSNLYVIATGLPYVTEYLPNVNNFILLYNYYENNFESLCKLLNQEVNNE